MGICGVGKDPGPCGSEVSLSGRLRGFWTFASLARTRPKKSDASKNLGGCHPQMGIGGVVSVWLDSFSQENLVWGIPGLPRVFLEARLLRLQVERSGRSELGLLFPDVAAVGRAAGQRRPKWVLPEEGVLEVALGRSSDEPQGGCSI